MGSSTSRTDTAAVCTGGTRHRIGGAQEQAHDGDGAPERCRTSERRQEEAEADKARTWTGRGAVVDIDRVFVVGQAHPQIVARPGRPGDRVVWIIHRLISVGTSFARVGIVRGNSAARRGMRPVLWSLDPGQPQGSRRCRGRPWRPPWRLGQAAPRSQRRTRPRARSRLWAQFAASAGPCRQPWSRPRQTQPAAPQAPSSAARSCSEFGRPSRDCVRAAHAMRSVAVTFASCCGPTTSAVGIPRAAAKAANWRAESESARVGGERQDGQRGVAITTRSDLLEQPGQPQRVHGPRLVPRKQLHPRRGVRRTADGHGRRERARRWNWRSRRVP